MAAVNVRYTCYNKGKGPPTLPLPWKDLFTRQQIWRSAKTFGPSFLKLVPRSCKNFVRGRLLPPSTAPLQSYACVSVTHGGAPSELKWE